MCGPQQKIFAPEVHEQRKNLQNLNKIRTDIRKSNNGQVDTRIAQDPPVYSSGYENSAGPSTYEKSVSTATVNAMGDYSGFSAAYASYPSPSTPVSTTYSVPASPGASFSSPIRTVSTIPTSPGPLFPNPLTPVSTTFSVPVSPGASYMNLSSSSQNHNLISAAAATPHPLMHHASLPLQTSSSAQTFLPNQNVNTMSLNAISEESEHHEKSSSCQPSEYHSQDPDSEESSDDEATGIVIFGKGI